MIKNERQYRITKSQAQRFERALARIQSPPTDQDGTAQAIHPLLRKAEEDALNSQLEDLRRQLGEYEDLAKGGQETFVSHSFEDLPNALIRARIAAGLSQKDLAERLGLKEQQVQRYEATEYSSASLERVKAVIRALGVTVREEVSFVR